MEQRFDLHPLTHPETADSLWPEKSFVARERGEIYVQRIYVDRIMARGLGEIDKDEGPELPRDQRHLPDWEDRSGYVRGMGKDQQSGRPAIPGDVSSQLVSIELTPWVYSQDTLFDAVRKERADGAPHGVVVEAGPNDAVPGTENAANRDVQGVSGIELEGDPTRIATDSKQPR